MVAIVGGVDQLADVTQTRPDVAVPGSYSEVTFGVAVKHYNGSYEEAGRALWDACAGTIPSVEIHEGLEKVGPRSGEFRVTVTPAIGRNANDRLRGCLRDATVDRVQGRVIGIVHYSAEEFRR